MPCLQRLAVSFVFEGAEEVARQRFMKHVDLTMQRVGGECVRVAVTSSSSRVRLLNEKCLAILVDRHMHPPMHTNSPFFRFQNPGIHQ